MWYKEDVDGGERTQTSNFVLWNLRSRSREQLKPKKNSRWHELELRMKVASEGNKWAVSSHRSDATENEVALRALTLDQVRQIDSLLWELGPFAELRLVKTDGKLRYMLRLQSESLCPP